ncbi:hypothetical protein LSH36_238g02048 [Paralvinella palmiformis]|uniref:Proteasomal ATPase-associated factor 1 n=1 Tax=Paralvinella palmiformis TaxID=53620 RepID=A0AAD9N5X8_9ANNE|nr:hypothetical protein LSH36_238g02048 [Paralvinella palmiformis]
MAMQENSRIIVQSDWDVALREDDGKTWVTYRNDATGKRVHGSIKCHAISSSGQPYVSATDGFSVEEISKKLLTVSYHNEDLAQACKFQAPHVTFATVHQLNKSVISMDVSPGGLAVSSDMQGNVNVWTTNNGEVRRQLCGHYGDVYTCRFFPSGVVILTGGADTQLKIWSAETGQCINDTCVVERGRNIVSVSRDGTARIWDCGSQTCVGVLGDLGGIVNGCSLGVTDREIDLLQPEQRPSNCPLQHIHESRAAILSLLPYRRGLFISTGDGSCFYISEDYKTDLELTGPDCDPVYRVVSDGSYLYSSCRDGLIRKYKPFL